jgi:hypothetical protein
MRKPARVSHSGFIVSPKPGDPSLSAGKIHTFDLTPFLAAVPSLCHTLGRILADRPADADHRLQTRCTACSGFAGCYAQALSREEIQFLPALTKGELMALREMGCTTLEKTARVLENMAKGSEYGRSDMKSRLSPSDPALAVDRSQTGAAPPFLPARAGSRLLLRPWPGVWISRDPDTPVDPVPPKRHPRR